MGTTEKPFNLLYNVRYGRGNVVEQSESFIMDAEAYVKEHRTCMYPLLPIMRGVHADLILQVVKE